MADITVTVGTKVAEKALTESPKTSGDVSAFDQVLSDKMGGAQNSSSSPMSGSEKFRQEMNTAFGPTPEKQVNSISGPDIQQKTLKIEVNPEIRTNGRAVQLLTEVNRSALQMDDLMKMMTSGQKFSASELLYIQANMHDIVLRTEMAMKIGEQGAGSFKQINQTQI